MAFPRAFRLESLLQVGVFLPAVLTSVFMFTAWPWPGPDGLSASRLWDKFSVLGSLTCVLKPQSSRSVCNRGLTAEFLTGCVQVFVAHVVLPAGTLVSVATFWEKLEARNVSDSMPDWQSFCRRFCLLSAPSKPAAPHPWDDTAVLLLSCGRVFALRQDLWLILHACFFVLNIAKRHFSLHFLHIQSCSLQYKRLLARLERWETPLTEDMDCFFLWGYFALCQLLCLRCICERLLQVLYDVCRFMMKGHVRAGDGGYPFSWWRGRLTSKGSWVQYWFWTCFMFWYTLSGPWSTASEDCLVLSLQISDNQLCQCTL